MAVEQLFWKYMKEYGGLDYIEFDYRGVTYQAVSGYQIYRVHRNRPNELLHEYNTLEEMLDAPDFADGVSLRQILHEIEEKDFFWG